MNINYFELGLLSGGGPGGGVGIGDNVSEKLVDFA